MSTPADSVTLDSDESAFLAELLATPGLNIPLGTGIEKLRTIVRLREKLAPFAKASDTNQG